MKNNLCTENIMNFGWFTKMYALIEDWYRNVHLKHTLFNINLTHSICLSEFLLTCDRLFIQNNFISPYSKFYHTCCMFNMCLFEISPIDKHYIGLSHPSLNDRKVIFNEITVYINKLSKIINKRDVRSWSLHKRSTTIKVYYLPRHQIRLEGIRENNFNHKIVPLFSRSKLALDLLKYENEKIIFPYVFKQNMEYSNIQRFLVEIYRIIDYEIIYLNTIKNTSIVFDGYKLMPNCNNESDKINLISHIFRVSNIDNDLYKSTIRLSEKYYNFIMNHRSINNPKHEFNAFSEINQLLQYYLS